MREAELVVTGDGDGGDDGDDGDDCDDGDN